MAFLLWYYESKKDLLHILIFLLKIFIETGVGDVVLVLN